MSRVTLRDIALSLGVSVSTVSLALRGSERIPSPVREKIVRRAEALGYRTDLAGSLLRATKPNIIGLTCDVEKELHVAYSREITAPAEELGYLVVTEDTAAGNGANALARIMQLHARAVIVVDPVMTDSAASAAVDVPVVAIGQTAPRQDADLVISNNATGMAQVSELVGDCSHVHYSQVHYLEGAVLVGRAPPQRLPHGDAPRRAAVRVIPSGPTVDAGWRSVHDVLVDAQPLVCYNDQCAQGALIALWRARPSAPGDNRVVGFDNTRIASSEAFGLTPVDRQPREVARLALRPRERPGQGRPVRPEAPGGRHAGGSSQHGLNRSGAPWPASSRAETRTVVGRVRGAAGRCPARSCSDTPEVDGPMPRRRTPRPRSRGSARPCREPNAACRGRRGSASRRRRRDSPGPRWSR